jgi:hypothetical protein
MEGSAKRRLGVVLFLVFLLACIRTAQVSLCLPDYGNRVHVFRVLFLFYPNTELQGVSIESIEKIIGRLNTFTSFFKNNTGGSLEIIYYTITIDRKLYRYEMENITTDGQIRYFVSPSTVRDDIEKLGIDPRFYEAIIVYYGIRWPYVAHGGCSWGAKGYFGETGFISIPIAPDGYIISDKYADFLIEVAVHEFLHVIDDMYEISGDSSFYNPDEMEKWTNYTRPYDYYKWILRNWPSEKWYTLKYGFNIQRKGNKYLINMLSTISYKENGMIDITGNVSLPLPNLKIYLYISVDNETWLLFRETYVLQDSSFKFNIKLSISGIIHFKLVLPETENVAGIEEKLSPIYLMSEKETQLVAELESLKNRLKLAEAKVAELEEELRKIHEHAKTQYFVTASTPYSSVEGEGWYSEGSFAILKLGEVEVGDPLIRYVFDHWEGLEPKDIVMGPGIVSVYVDRPRVLKAVWRVDYSRVYALALILTGVVAASFLALSRRRRSAAVAR